MSGAGGARVRLLAAGLVLGAVVALVAVAETWLLPALRGLPRAAYLNGFVADAEVEADVTLNALGLTGDALAPGPRSPDTLRVLTLGGSVLFNRHMTERLRGELEAASVRPVEILGGALRAHTTWSSLHKWRWLRDRGFDLVLIQHGINDLKANHVAPADFREDYGHLGPWYRRGPLLDHSVIARVVHNELLWRRPSFVLMGSGLRSVEVLARNLDTLVEEVRAAGARPVLLSLPWWIPSDYSYEAFVAGALPYANPERYDYCPVELWGPVDWVREGLQRTGVAVHALAGRRDVPLVDVARHFGSDPALFGDVCHPSERGAAVFARYVVGELAARGWLGAAPGRAPSASGAGASPVPGQRSTRSVRIGPRSGPSRVVVSRTK